MRFLAIFMLFACTNALANLGFEAGTLTGWTVSGNDVSVVGTTNVSPGGGNNWTVTPYGTRMGLLKPAGSVQFDTATTQLGLTSVENTAIKNYLTFQSQNGGGGNPTPTNAAWIKREITLQAGTTYTFGWNYLSTDYTPFNDGSMMTLTHSTNAGITPILNNSQQRYALLGFTNPGTGNYATGSYGSTGWQRAQFTVPETGTYVLGFASFNLGDTVLSPMLFIDEIQGTTMLNGQTFTPVAPNEGSTAPPPEPVEPSLCCGGSSAAFSIDVEKSASMQDFINRTTQDSQVYIEQIGNSNTIMVNQTGTRNNYVDYYGNGSFNNIDITQSGNSSTVANYVDLDVVGNSNNIDVVQQSTGGAKGLYATVNNNSNTVTILQKDAGNHYIDLSLSGGSKTVDITQQGSADHMADITLGGEGARSLSLTQQGTTQQFYSINSTCAGSCQTITVIQGQ
jgi:fibronectin-binding autotransporter adhesin